MRYYYNVIVSPDHSNSSLPDGRALRTSDRGNVVVLVLTEQNRFPRFTFFADDGRLVAVWAGWQCGAGCCQNNFFPVLRQLAGPTPPHWPPIGGELCAPPMRRQCRPSILENAETVGWTERRISMKKELFRSLPAGAVRPGLTGGRKEGRKEGLTN